MPVVQFNLEHGVGQRLFHCAFQHDCIIFGQNAPPTRDRPTMLTLPLHHSDAFFLIPLAFARSSLQVAPIAPLSGPHPQAAPSLRNPQQTPLAFARSSLQVAPIAPLSGPHPQAAPSLPTHNKHRSPLLVPRSRSLQSLRYLDHIHKLLRPSPTHNKHRSPLLVPRSRSLQSLRYLDHIHKLLRPSPTHNKHRSPLLVRPRWRRGVSQRQKLQRRPQQPESSGERRCGRRTAW